MQVRMKVRCLLAAAAATFVAAAVALACSQSAAPFQPIVYGAEPWTPPEGWSPDACATGYFIAIDTCKGCTGTSYALCTGLSYTECVCGGPFSSGATCPQTLPCTATDFPPPTWTEYTDYVGPGWAGLDDAGSGG
jgi:hypothetical protein